MLEKNKMKELAELMEEYELTEIEYEIGDEKLCLKRENPAFKAGLQTDGINAGTGNVVGQASSKTIGKIIKAPLVGTFYSAPEKGKPPYVKTGDSVKKGQVIGIIEAMKLMNEIESDCDGVVEEILAENGSLVEYGQGLVRLR